MSTRGEDRYIQVPSASQWQEQYGRQSGRTTAMLEQAAIAKANGHRILIIASSYREFQTCMMSAYRANLPNLELKDFTTPGIAIRGRIRGVRPENIFVDHYVWEAQPWHGDVHRLSNELEFLRRRRDPLMASQNKYAIFYEDTTVLNAEAVRGLLIPDPWCDCSVHS